MFGASLRKVSEKNRADLSKILDVRKNYPDSSLADLYDSILMPKDMRDAHRKNDSAVMEAYGFSGDMTESEIVGELMKMYFSKKMAF